MNESMLFSRISFTESKLRRDFKNGKVHILVGTDVAARGIDVSSIGLVVQADSPRDIDTYTHRAGRTGRAGRLYFDFSFCSSFCAHILAFCRTIDQGKSGDCITLLEPKSGVSIASGIVDLLVEANQIDSIPAWLQGMSYIAKTRAIEEEMAIDAGSTNLSIDDATEPLSIDDSFSEQDFRRTAVEGSYGINKDVAYRGFDNDAYSDIEVHDSVNAKPDPQSENMPADAQVPAIGREVANVGRGDGWGSEAAFDVPFQRNKPSARLMQLVGDQLDNPDKVVLDTLSKKSQLLKFEYIGLFPFDDVSPLLMSQSNDKSDDRVRVLMVAEKPSIAKSIADALSGNRGPRQVIRPWL